MTNWQQTRLEAELKREYRHLVNEIERLTGKYSYDHIESQVDQIFQRQRQIIKELEVCTGVKIPIKTREDILQENREEMTKK